MIIQQSTAKSTFAPLLQVFEPGIRVTTKQFVAAMMEASMNQVRELYGKADADERQKIQEQLRDLQRDLYTDWEILFGLATGVSHLASTFSL